MKSELVARRISQVNGWGACFARLAERLADLVDGRAARTEPPIELPPALIEAGMLFGLSRFDCDLLLLAVAAECDREIARTLERLTGSARPSIGVAAELYADGLAGAPLLTLERVVASSPLVDLALLRVDGDGPLSTRTLAVPDDVWPRWVGISTAAPFELERGPALDPGREDLRGALELATRWLLAAKGQGAIIDLAGPVGSGRDRFASALAARVGRPVMKVAGATGVPDGARRIAREAIWSSALVVVESVPEAPSLTAFLVARDLPVAIKNGGPEVTALAHTSRCALHRVEFPLVGHEVRSRWWDQILPLDRDPDVDPSYFAARYPFGPTRIAVAAHLACGDHDRDERVSVQALDHACRASSALNLQGLGTRLPADRNRDALVLGDDAWRELDLAIHWVKHAPAVARSAPSHAHRTAHGPVALFHGPSGTGKTLAAQVLASELGLDLVAVELSRVVDKYIGETEKNLDRLFSEVAGSGAVLFFDEADALFARRTEVKDAHDRYANLETGFLLQRLERHRGPVILATNQRANIDAAFMRRIHISVAFALPEAPQRARIWELHLPALEARDADVDPVFLAARIALTGGEIRNASFVAGLLAAAESNRLAMRHVVRAVYRELGKIGRLVEPIDFGPWHDVLEDAQVGRRARR